MPASPRLVSPQQLAATPWANGAGTTKVLHAHQPPEPADGADFSWRLSLAELARSAAFSSLPGVDRTFTLASPGFLSLHVDGSDHTLALGQSVRFRGEDVVRLHLPTEQPHLGLNLMTRRGSCEGRTDVAVVRGTLVLDPDAGVVAATVLSGVVRDTAGRTLTPHTTLLLEGHRHTVWADGALLAISSVHPCRAAAASGAAASGAAASTTAVTGAAMAPATT